MEKEQMKKKIVTLFQRKRKIEEEIKNLQNRLVKQLCPKRKQECEPAYCTFRITDTCPFLKEWSNILKEGQVEESI